jgi:arsenate reductase-like glutaredoxin family protein
LRRLGVEMDEVDYAKRGLDEATVRALVAAAGGVGAVLNVRHATAKANGWTVAAPPDVGTFAKAVASEPNLIRRPILLVGDRAVVGFDEAAYAKL